MLTAEGIIECFTNANWIYRPDAVGNGMLFLNSEGLPEGMWRRAAVWHDGFGWRYECWYLKGTTEVQPITTYETGAVRRLKFDDLQGLVMILAGSSVKSHPLKEVRVTCFDSRLQENPQRQCCRWRVADPSGWHFYQCRRFGYERVLDVPLCLQHAKMARKIVHRFKVRQELINE